MSARKLIEFGDARLVRVHAGFTALEISNGSDWLGVARWQCATTHDRARRVFRTMKLDDGRVIEVIEREWVERLLNQLGDAMMRENGLPTPDEMHAVPLPKLAEIFAPDAVLYLTVHEWGTSYQVVNSATTVTLEGRLVDADTGLDLWAGRATAVKSSGNGGGGLAGLLADALVTQISSSVYDPTPEVARVATDRLLVDPSVGLLIGPRHPEFGEAKR